MQGRKWDDIPNSLGSYKFGINGQLKDNEIYGEGNAYSAKFWEYDTRLGRRWNVDPVTKEWESSYAVFANNPILLIDPNGLDTITTPNGEKINAGDGYIATPDGKFLYGTNNGQDLQLQYWDWNLPGYYSSESSMGRYRPYDPSTDIGPELEENAEVVENGIEAIGSSLAGNIGHIFLAGRINRRLGGDFDMDEIRQLVYKKAVDLAQSQKGAFSFTFKTDVQGGGGPRERYFGGRPNTWAPMWAQGATVFAVGGSGYLAGGPFGAVGSIAYTYLLFPKTWNLSVKETTWIVGRNHVTAFIEVSAKGKKLVFDFHWMKTH